MNTEFALLKERNIILLRITIWMVMRPSNFIKAWFYEEKSGVKKSSTNSWFPILPKQPKRNGIRMNLLLNYDQPH